MSKVITVTLNPSLDRTMIVHYLHAGYPNRTTEPTRLDPAGRGVNISRGLQKLGCSTNAVILLGNDPVSHSYQNLMSKEVFPATFITRNGRTRSNVILVDTGNKTETHLIEESTVGTEEDIVAILETLQTITQPGDDIVFAGDITFAGPKDTYARLLAQVKEFGAFVTMFTTGEPLKQALNAQPSRVVITQHQLEGIANYPLRTPEDCIYAARGVLERGVQELVVLMLGDGVDPAAVVVNHQGVWRINAPYAESERGTTSGIEDALLAGMFAGFLGGKPYEEALRLGGAAASYTASQIGNEFGTVADIEELLESVSIVSAQDASASVV